MEPISDKDKRRETEENEMLSEERIEEIANEVAAPVSRYLPYWRTSVDFARAIEAAVLPEGWVAVPKEPSQASPLDLMECLQDRPVEPSKAVQGKCVTKAVKQEPVKDEPVAWMVVTPYDKLIFQNASQAEHYAEKWELVSAPLYTRPQQEPVKDEPVAEFVEDESAVGRAKFKLLKPLKVGTKLYTRPQPDLTAEVERLKGMVSEIQAARFVMNQHDQHVKRIAELEEAAREARDSAICECIKVAEEEAKDLEKLRDIALARQESATIEATNILAINRCIELMKTMSSSA